jgi:small subunit ribosomal protein S20
LRKGDNSLANHKSAEKRARQNIKRRIRNKSVKTRLKHRTKDVRLAVGESSKEAAQSKLVNAQSAIDNAAKKGVIHKKTAARKISRLSKLVNNVNT